MKKIFKHRSVITPLNVTLIGFILCLILGLRITSIVILFNPFIIEYFCKMFRKV